VDQALKEAQEAVRIQPYSADGYRNLAFAYHARGEPDLATEAAQQAVKLAPKQDTVHYVLGLCYMNQGETEKAMAEFEEFLALYWDRAYARDLKVKAEEYLAQLR
jgi:Tfp pilus assembly protein PilF